jgi:hypothetical protein
MTLPPLAPVGLIRDRLQTIYPEGSPNRTYCVREMAAKTILVVSRRWWKLQKAA